MIVPATMNIYSGEAMLKDRKPEFLTSEVKELRASSASMRVQGDGAAQSGFEEGYLLGLETARAILAGSPVLMLANIDAKSVL